MNDTDRVSLFDDWATDYDRDLATYGAAFPFAGYDQILKGAVALCAAEAPMRILELGVGTGNLAAHFVAAGCQVWGADFSGRMLMAAQAKLPGAHLVQMDLLEPWPAALEPPFDRVVSSYVLHEFPLEDKMRLLERIARHYLAEGGAVVVADIAFPSVAARAVAAQRWAADWDPHEAYWAADETALACSALGLQVSYQQVSSCGGIFRFTR